ncbi:MAG: hypothetical protein ACR2KZ_00410 [Segetibacter sp.]
MKKLILFLPMLSVAVVKAQRQVIHTDLIPRMQANTETKLLMNKTYEDKLNQIKENRDKTLAYATTIEEVQKKVFSSLTNVDGALRNGKTLIYISRKIPHIFSNLVEASELAAGKPFLATIAADQARIITERVVKLQNYLNDFVLKDDSKTLINPTDRAKFVHEVYENILIIDNMSLSLINSFKLYNLQDAVNKVVPFQMYKNVDKILIQDIVKKVKL